VRDNSGEEVSKSNCDQDKKPSHKQQCNTQPCPARLVENTRVGMEEKGRVEFIAIRKRNVFILNFEGQQELCLKNGVSKLFSLFHS